MNRFLGSLHTCLVMMAFALAVAHPWFVSAQETPLYLVITPENADRLVLLKEIRPENIPYIEFLDIEYLAWSKDNTAITLSHAGWGVHIDTNAKVLTPQARLPVAYNHQDKPLAISFTQSTIILSHVLTGDTVLELPYSGKEWVRFTFNRDGTRLAVSSIDYSIDVWDLVLGQHLWTLTKHEIPAFDLAFNSSGTLLASGSYDNLALLWDISAGKLQCDLSWADVHIEALAFNPDGSRLAVGGTRGLQLLDVDTILKSQCASDRARTPSVPPAYVMLHGDTVTGGSPAVAFSLDGVLLAEGGTYGTFPYKNPDTFIRLRTANNGAVMAEYAVSTIPEMLAFSPNGQFLAVAGSDHLQLWGIPAVGD